MNLKKLILLFWVVFATCTKSESVNIHCISNINYLNSELDCFSIYTYTNNINNTSADNHNSQDAMIRNADIDVYMYTSGTGGYFSNVGSYTHIYIAAHKTVLKQIDQVTYSYGRNFSNESVTDNIGPDYYDGKGFSVKVAGRYREVRVEIKFLNSDYTRIERGSL